MYMYLQTRPYRERLLVHVRALHVLELWFVCRAQAMERSGTSEVR